MMSIATVGPAKYDFQDLVCIKFALQFYKKEMASLVVEGIGAEDAEISIQENGKKSIFEIQVKGSLQHYGMPLIAECLGHFPAHQKTDFFLQRIIEDPDRYAVLVMSGRGDDTLQKFIPRGEWQGGEHTTVIFTKSDVNALISAILSYAETLSGTTLQTDRNDYIKKYIQNTNWRTIRDALKRVIVLDCVTEKSINEDCRYVLRKDFYIPDDYFEIKIDILRTEIKAGRQSKNDIMPDIVRKLRENPIQSVRPLSYALRGDEDELSVIIQQKNVLMLSGKPRVGKSNTARWIAAKYQDQGYRVLNTQDVDTAERFILDPDRSHRLVLIDDPLGGAHTVNNQNDKWQVLNRIINNTNQGRKIIIAQGQERLFEFCHVQHLSNASLSGNHWIDLSKVPSEFLLRCWDLYKDQLPVEFYQTVRNFIQEDRLDIEPGCLTFLALTYKDLGTKNSPEDIIRFARKDAADLGRGLEGEGYKDLLLGLAVATSHLENVHDTDLAYILTNEEHDRYGLSKSVGGSTSYCLPAKVQEINFPNYTPYPELGKDVEDKLERLESRQIVYSDDSEKNNFTHPFYRSAAESLFEYTGRRGFKIIEKALRNSIFCLSPNTARAAAGNLRWIYNRTDNTANKDQLIKIAVDGLDSSYPSVRDVCFEFLIELTPELNIEYQKDIPSWIYKVASDRSSALRWEKGQPWYPMNTGLIFNTTFYHEYDKPHVEEMLNQIALGQNIVLTPKDAYDILSHCKQDPTRLNHSLMTKILSINEGFIRALAAKLWMIKHRDNDKDIFERIFRDKHPAVAEEVFQSAVRAWNYYPEERQQHVLDALASIATQPVLANAIIDILVIFERDYATGDNPPWNVFSRLFPIALSSLPAAAHVNFARLSNVVDEARNKLLVDEMLRILSSWINFLEKQKGYIDSFGLNVTETLLTIDLPENLETQRFILIKRLLSLKATGDKMRVLQDLSYHWSVLSEDEQDFVIAQIIENRPDKYWLWASVILTKNCPIELKNHILPNNGMDSLVVDTVTSLETNLFEAIFLCATANTHANLYHLNSELQYELVKKIAMDLSHPLSPLAIEFAIIFFTEKELFMCDLVQSLPQEQIQFLFDIVFYFYADSNPEYMPEFWKSLFERASPEKISNEWLPKFVEFSNKIFDSLSSNEVQEFIPNEWMNEFYQSLPDSKFYTYITSIFKSALCERAGEKISLNSGIRDSFYKYLCQLNDENPPSHRSTYRYIIGELRKADFSPEQLAIFEKAQQSLFERKKCDIPFKRVELKNWQY